jgi:hypothetical protein
VLAMLNPGHDLPLCRAVAGELVGDHDAWRPHLLLQQFAQEPLGGLLVAAAAAPVREMSENRIAPSIR